MPKIHIQKIGTPIKIQSKKYPKYLTSSRHRGYFLVRSASTCASEAMQEQKSRSSRHEGDPMLFRTGLVAFFVDPLIRMQRSQNRWNSAPI